MKIMRLRYDPAHRKCIHLLKKHSVYSCKLLHNINDTCLCPATQSKGHGPAFGFIILVVRGKKESRRKKKKRKVEGKRKKRKVEGKRKKRKVEGKRKNGKKESRRKKKKRKKGK